MIYLEIPFVSENNRVNRTSAENELQILKLSDAAKADVFDAIYHYYPKGVSFENNEMEQVLSLENALSRLRIPFRQVVE